MERSPYAPYAPRSGDRPERLPIEVAPATSDQVERLAHLQVGVRGGTVPEWSARISRALAHPEGLVVAALQRDAPVGYANLALLPAHQDGAPAGYYLTGVTVAAPWRRHGVGRALTRYRVEWIWRRRPEAWCFVSAGNRASVDLHLDLGFTVHRRGPSFQGVGFTGGEGLLLRAVPASGFAED
ncbi:GNAT family N-acetyltransferase [Streptomyces sp. NPDC005438]|uniref:GNAT family N-acetyltransferase n=1 Tax=Streptomyces sp. NPDC005438 TaxID=3156880 RepID=UPI0033AC75CC